MYKRNKALVKELKKPLPGTSDLYFLKEFAQSSYGQFKACLWKQWWTYWRSPDYNLVRFLYCFITALLLGSVFWNIAHKRDTVLDLTMIVGAMYVCIVFTGFTSCFAVQPVVAIERTVFYRERAAGMYSALPYAFAQIIVEIPYVLVQSIYFTPLIYGMLGFEWTVVKFSWFFSVSFLSFLYFTYYGMMCVAITPNEQVAQLVAATFFTLFNLFSGFFVPRSRIPKWWIWYYWACPVAWTVNGLVTPQYGDMEDLIIVPGRPSQTIKSYIKDYFGYSLDFMPVVAGVLVGFTFLFAFVFAHGIRKFNFQYR